ncbi:hypothetical protein O9G_003041 [Rozella allomycis CSF55]|uniref:Uncharacterized protein n=1 Tax=Rozella allomycis (strain CSF55) TaxID=988480 RepID=A0A075AYM9_ROZAC|nr:hypothetical protein O9G_003041 [Rozella allomycis CSF55]|eukprot:EPZ35387.1 hypothetical protein O9G_003041 [Rozella allomycis CSF55]
MSNSKSESIKNALKLLYFPAFMSGIALMFGSLGGMLFATARKDTKALIRYSYGKMIGAGLSVSLFYVPRIGMIII